MKLQYTFRDGRHVHVEGVFCPRFALAEVYHDGESTLDMLTGAEVAELEMAGQAFEPREAPCTRK